MGSDTIADSRTRLRDGLFYVALGALFTHELDAMPNREWRNLPILSSLADDVAMPLFVALHVPLFAIVVAFVASPRPRTRRLARLGVAVFVVVHAGLHAASVGHPAYEFSSTLSNVLIFGGAAAAAAFLGLARASRA